MKSFKKIGRREAPGAGLAAAVCHAAPAGVAPAEMRIDAGDPARSAANKYSHGNRRGSKFAEMTVADLTGRLRYGLAGTQSKRIRQRGNRTL